MSLTLTLVLSANDVNIIMLKHSLNQVMDDLIFKLIEEFESFDGNKTIVPIRAGFNYNNDYPGLVEWMPLYKTNEEVVIKVVGYHPKNPEKFNLPTILSTISTYDTKTGHLKGIADGVLLTALRTGATSAVASKFMAHPDSSTLGLIGCGAQSITQLHSLSRIFLIEKVLIYDVDPEAMEKFEQRISILDLHVEVLQASIDMVLSHSDIVCTQTSIDIDEGPLFNAYKVKPHLHINAIGSDFPGKIELPLELLKESFVCADFIEQAKKEGECQQLDDSAIHADLVTIIKKPKSFETVKNQLSVFDSTGWAVEDQVVMDLFLDLASEFKIGTKVSLENISSDVKNPYHFLYSSVKA